MIPLRGSLHGRSSPAVTLLLIVANLWVFAHEAMLRPRAFEHFMYVWGLVPSREVAAGSVVFTLLNALTSMFVHGGWMHVLGNMLYLWVFGSGLEGRIGHVRFSLLYFASGIVASQAQVWLTAHSSEPIVGASGAIAGVLGAYYVVAPHATIRAILPIWIVPFFFNVPAVLYLGGWFLFQTLAGAGIIPNNGGVAWWAHVGGFLAGALLVKNLGVPPAPRERDPSDDWTPAREG